MHRIFKNFPCDFFKDVLHLFSSAIWACFYAYVQKIYYLWSKLKNYQMKRFILPLLSAGLLAACNSAVDGNISGELKNANTDGLIVYSYYIGDRDNPQVDTIALKNGKFSLNLEDSVLRQVAIYPKVSENQPADFKVIDFLLLPGKKVQISGSFDNYQLSGAPYYDDLNEINKISKSYVNSVDSVINLCRNLQMQGVAEDSIMNVYSSVEGFVKSMEEDYVKYISENPEKEISVYLSSVLSYENMEKSIPLISEQTAGGVMAPLFNVVKERFDKETQRRVAEERIQPGKPAPDFVLKDIDGNDFSLSSLKGKYVVLDFWGSWCGWCIKGIPEMKEAYNKYKSKVEFVGIACRDKEDDWKKAVAQYELPWINVFNAGEPDVSTDYAIQGYPTKIVVDKQGNIAKVVVGEDPEFYKYLEELFK